MAAPYLSMSNLLQEITDIQSSSRSLSINSLPTGADFKARFFANNEEVAVPDYWTEGLKKLPEECWQRSTLKIGLFSERDAAFFLALFATIQEKAPATASVHIHTFGYDIEAASRLASALEPFASKVYIANHPIRFHPGRPSSQQYAPSLIPVASLYEIDVFVVGPYESPNKTRAIRDAGFFAHDSAYFLLIHQSAGPHCCEKVAESVWHKKVFFNFQSLRLRLLASLPKDAPERAALTFFHEKITKSQELEAKISAAFEAELATDPRLKLDIEGFFRGAAGSQELLVLHLLRTAKTIHFRTMDCVVQ